MPIVDGFIVIDGLYLKGINEETLIWNIMLRSLRRDVWNWNSFLHKVTYTNAIWIKRWKNESSSLTAKLAYV